MPIPLIQLIPLSAALASACRRCCSMASYASPESIARFSAVELLRAPPASSLHIPDGLIESDGAERRTVVTLQG